MTSNDFAPRPERRGGNSEHRPRTGFFRRLVRAIATAEQRELDRRIGRLLSTQGRFNDDFERRVAGLIHDPRIW